MEGEHTIVVAESRKDGSFGDVSDAFDFVVDTVAPASQLLIVSSVIG